MTSGPVLVVVGLVLLYAAARVRLYVANKAVRELTAELTQARQAINAHEQRIEQLSPGGPGVACCHEVEQCRHRKLFPGDAPVQFGPYRPERDR